ncbi:DNA-binding transcriptional regulator, LacI/PurR family [Friedmanniella luteola]|uniref:DNA-binding transcriptional regulator, LacI/PurR family n=1 Tax=Friedmanniella luteola TaxID=546871 RepID=A0A1H1TXD5_9ACTN|nr:LacI family DNA-binding transcriptional regulator [Friedmanniella luteola]SDS64890.1 DNA-binding transcriptional regulator, LacI/PurR family [Friedmanniella luteola]
MSTGTASSRDAAPGADSGAPRDDGSRTAPADATLDGGVRPVRGQPTLEMVAAASGVSRSTVSRVVNRSPNVRPEVAAAVQRAIDDLNYVPNRAARSLAGRHTYAIALLVPEDATRFFGDPYFASIVQGITGALESSDYVLNLLVARDGAGGKTRRYLQGGNVDGALVVSHHPTNTDLRDINASLPVVFGGRPAVPDLDPCYSVDVDNVGGARLAAAHLVGLGRRRIGTVTGPLDMPAAVDRLAGWRQVLETAGRPPDAVVSGDFTTAGGAAAMRDLLARVPDLDAVFVANDLMARGALTVLTERGLDVPGDVAVVGYDDSPAAISGDLPLSTVSQPSTAMGARMTEMLLGLLAGREPESRACVLQTRLVLRATA